MIRRRYIGILVALGVMLAILAAAVPWIVADALTRVHEYYNNGEFTGRPDVDVVGLQLMGQVLTQLQPWVVLAALVPIVAALALVTLRARAR